MERELFSIERSPRGWLVRDDSGPTEGPDPTPRLALEHASKLAYRRYASTGHPTGVKVRMQCGDMVLFACHG